MDGHPKRPHHQMSKVPSLMRILRKPGGPDQLDGHPIKKKVKHEVDDDEPWQWQPQFEEAPRSPPPVDDNLEEATDLDQPELIDQPEDTGVIDDNEVTVDDGDTGEINHTGEKDGDDLNDDIGKAYRENVEDQGSVHTKEAGRKKKLVLGKFAKRMRQVVTGKPQEKPEPAPSYEPAEESFASRRASDVQPLTRKGGRARIRQPPVELLANPPKVRTREDEDDDKPLSSLVPPKAKKPRSTTIDPAPGEREEAINTEPRIHMEQDIEMADEDAEDNMPLSELMELRKRREALMKPTGVKVEPELMQAVRRVHNNLGHPEASKLVRALRIAGAKEEAIEAAKKLKCDVCDQLVQPATRRPSQLPRAQNFNDHIAVDLFWVKDVTNFKVHDVEHR